MSEFTLGNWTFSDDEVNDELVFRSLNTNDEFRVDNTGGFSSDVDLKGNSLTDSTQDFLDLTGDGNNLRVASNQSIEDDSGTRRVSFVSGETSLRDSAGKTGFVARDGGSTRIDAYNGQPLDIRDQEGGYDAVRYNTSATAPGTFEFPNASIDMGGNNISNAGILNGGQVGTSSEPVDVEAATVSADSVNADSVNIADTLATQGLAYTMSFGRPLSDPSSTSSATFERIADMVGGVPPYGEAPAGATLQGNLVVRASSVPSGETGTYRVEMLNLDVGGGAAVDELDSITVDVTDSNTTESGWTDIEGDLSGGDRYPVTKSLQGKVTSGTLDSNAKDFFVVLFRWVID